MTTENLPEGCVSTFTDTAGNRHHLRTGKVAAQMIVDGDTPELLFNDCKEMHHHLTEMGIFPSQGPRVANKGFQYVVYHGKPPGSAGDESESSNFRVLSNWSTHGLTAWTQDLPGWGLESESPILDVPVSKFDPFLHNFCVTTSTPLLLPYSEEQRRGVLVPIDMDPALLAKLFLQWKDERTLSGNISEITRVIRKADPVYLGSGSLEVVMKVKAFDCTHAEYIAAHASRAFLDELITQMGCTPRPRLSNFSLVEPEGLQEAPAAMDSDRPRF